MKIDNYNMKTLTNKLKSGVKTTVKTISKYATIAAMTATSITAMGQSYDSKEIAVMDPFSRPNIVSMRSYGDGDVNSDGAITMLDAQEIYMGTKNNYADVNGDNIFNIEDAKIIEDYVNGNIDHLPGDIYSQSTQEKKDWFGKRINGNLIYPLHGKPRPPLCQNYSKRLQLIFTGLGNFENYPGVDNDLDGIAEGYAYYNPIVELGKENLPLYLVGTENMDGVDHMVVGAFVGPEDYREKKDDTQASQWAFWSYRDGTEIKSGNAQITLNGDLDIMGLSYYYSKFAGKNVYSTVQILNFDLKNGVATLAKDFGNPADPQGYIQHLLREDPRDINLTMEDETKYIESTTEDVDVSISTLDEPVIETNSEFYTPTTELVSSEFTPFDDKYTEYGVAVQKIKGGYFEDNKMGRWHAGNLENLVTSMTRTITINDKTAPEVPNLEGEQSLEYSVTINDEIDNIQQDKIDNSDMQDASKAKYGLIINPLEESTQVMDGSINQVNYSVTKTTEVSDVSKNKTTKTFTYNVSDNTPPVVTLNDYFPKIEKDENPVEAVKVLKVTDNSGLPITEEKYLNANYPEGIIEETDAFRKYSVLLKHTDVAGKATLTEAVVEMDKLGDDIIAPDYTRTLDMTMELTPAMKTKSGLESIIESTVPIDINDNRDENPTSSYSYEIFDKDSVNDDNYEIRVNFVATDNVGNSEPSSYSIFIEDTTAPTFEIAQPTEEVVPFGTNLDSMALAAVKNIYDASGTGRAFIQDKVLNSEIDNYQYWDYNMGVTDATGNIGSGVFEAPGIRKFKVGVDQLNSTNVFAIHGLNISDGNIQLQYELTESGTVTFNIFNCKGQNIWIKDQFLVSGNNSIQIESQISNGLYILMGKTESGILCKATILAK